MVESPFVSDGASGLAGRARLQMGDRATIQADGRFQLQGRADRIVKIGEKRLSLPEMESQLTGLEWVREVALLPLEQAGEVRVAAVIAPSEAGADLLVDGGRRALTARLTDALGDHWDRVLLPRAWRVVPELPRDSRGKTPLAALRRLFEAGPDEPTPDPVRLAERREGDALERDLAVPRDLVWFDGHFPGRPIVPGVVQLGWALDAAAALLGAAPRVTRIEALKFQAVVEPLQRCRLRVELRESPRRVRFRLDGEVGGAPVVFSSGTCHLEGAA